MSPKGRNGKVRFQPVILSPETITRRIHVEDNRNRICYDFCLRNCRQLRYSGQYIRHHGGHWLRKSNDPGC